MIWFLPCFVFHPSRQVSPDGLKYGSDDGIKIKVGVGVLEMSEDTGERTPKQAATPLFNKLPSSLETILQANHHIGKEAEVAGAVVRMGMRSILITDVAQGDVCPVPEVLEHGGMHALQRPPLKHFFFVLPHDGLGVGDPLPERE